MAAAPRILIGTPLLAGRPAAYFEPLNEAGYALVWNELGRRWSEDELIDLMPGVVATVAGTEPYTARVLDAAPELKVIARYGVGYDAVDVDAATARGVAVAMAFGTNHDSVANFAFALMAALACRLVTRHNQVAAGIWQRDIHPALTGQTLGIVGLGRIGRTLARRAAAFDMRVVGFDPALDEAWARENRVTALELDALLAQADFVSLHVPLLPGTRNLIDARRLALMRPIAFLINTARGGLVDEAALADAIAGGRLGGAGLDVFATEPLTDSPLLALDNVILSPHAAGVDAHAEHAMGARCTANILTVLRGEDPGNGYLLRPEVLGTGD